MRVERARAAAGRAGTIFEIWILWADGRQEHIMAA